MVGRVHSAVLALAWITAAAAAANHSGDSNRDGGVSLSELLRVVQFYNSDGYHAATAGTEDGYAPGPGSPSSAPHDSDYAPQDWAIGLSELLRFVQFYNAGGCYGPVFSEDGYAPGQGGNPYLLPVDGDRDGDYLTDEEEAYLRTNPDVSDEDGDGVADGAALAVSLAREIAVLPQEYSEGQWRRNYVGQLCTATAPFSEEAVTLSANWLENELLTDEITGYAGLPRGALHFLEHGSFSYMAVNDDCDWLPEQIERTPAHFLYYLIYMVPENLAGTHLVALAGDSDGDYLTDEEEDAIGYDRTNLDEDDSGTLDGQDLARAMADIVQYLPPCYEYKHAGGPAKNIFGCGKSWRPRFAKAEARSDDPAVPCVDIVAMDCYFYDPVLGLRDDTDYHIIGESGGIYLSGLMLQIMRLEGSFSFYDCLFGCETFRLDVPLLYSLLDMGGE